MELVTESNVNDVIETSASALNKTKVKRSRKNKSGKCKKSGKDGVVFCFHDSRSHLVRVIDITSKGRCLISSRLVKPGIPLWREKAICVIAHERGNICASCHRPGIQYVSDRFDSFCSTTCMNELRGLLEIESNIDFECLASRHNCDRDLLRMTSRLLLSLTNRSCSSSAALFEDDGDLIVANYMGLLGLESYLELQGVAWRTSVGGAVRDVVQLVALKTQSIIIDGEEIPLGINSSDLLIDRITDLGISIAARINVNAYGIVNPDGSSNEPLGFGLYPIVGMCINHSCFPNTVYSLSTDGEMEYRTIMDVPEGHEITVSYIDILESTPRRRESLKTERFFYCTCVRCTAYDEALAYFKKGESFRSYTDSTFLCIESEEKVTPKSNTKSKKAADAQGERVLSLESSTEISPTAVIADIALEGLYCFTCGLEGVVFSTRVNNEIDVIAGCLVCCKEHNEVDVSLTLSEARSSWEVMANAVRLSTRDSSTEIERWLQRYDPLYAPPGSAVFATSAVKPSTLSSTVAVSVGRRVRKLIYLLHPNHILILKTLEMLAVSTLSAKSGTSSEVSRAVDALRRVNNVVTRVIPQNHPDASSKALSLCDALDRYIEILVAANSSSVTSAKTLQALRKEKNELLSRIYQARMTAFGAENPAALCIKNKVYSSELRVLEKLKSVSI